MKICTRIELACEPGDANRPNEDFASIVVPFAGSGGSVVVLDGVTPPTDGNTGCAHSVPWFTSRLGSTLQGLAVTERDLSLQECLAKAIASTARFHSDTCDLSHRRTPQSTVVAVRWDSEVLEYLVLSDSVLLLERTTGEVTAVLDTRLDRLPSRVLEMRTAVRALPSGSAEGAEADRWYARAVEECRNAEGGFFTAAADPDVAGLAMTGTVPLVDVVSFAALTDGMTRWVENFELGRWPELLAVLREGGTKELFRQVRAAEVADPEALWYHKVHDDATAVFVEL